MTAPGTAQGLIALAAFVAIANGAVMLVAPLDWYILVPTVRFTGLPNAHFIRDIGLAYLTCGAVLGYAAADPVRRWGAALAGAAWLAVHGALHITEVATGICTPGHFWIDAPGVLGPPLVVLAAVAIVRRRA